MVLEKKLKFDVTLTPSIFPGKIKCVAFKANLVTVKIRTRKRRQCGVEGGLGRAQL